MTTMVPVAIGGREDWTVMMPDWRASRLQYQEGTWELPRFQSMYANLLPGDVLFDVGTESGDQSALYAKWVSGTAACEPCQGRGAFLFDIGHGTTCRNCSGTGGRTGGVVLIEPNPVVWPCIKAIWEANDLPDPLVCWAGAAGVAVDGPTGEGGTWFTYWPPETDGPILSDHGFASLHANELPTIPLDLLTPEVIPDAITIDVEGSELFVLAGARHILATYRPLVWVSIHPPMLRDWYGLTRQDVLDFMADMGYRCEHLADEHEMHTLFWHPEGREPVLPYGHAE